MINRSSLNIRDDIRRMLNKTSPVETVQEDSLLPVVPVDLPSGELPTIEAGAHKKVMDNKRSQGGTAPESRFNFGEDSYQAHMYWNKTVVDAIENNMVKGKYSFDLEVEAAQHVRDILLTSRKYRLANAFMSDDTFTGSDYVSTPSTKFDNSTGGLDSFISEVSDAVDKIRSRTGLMRKACWIAMTEDAMFNIIDQLVASERFKYTDNLTLATDEVQRQAVAKVARVGGVKIVGSLYDDSKFEATTNNFTDMYADEDMLVYVPSPGATLQKAVQGIGFQPAWKGWTTSYLIDSWEDKDVMGENVRVSEFRGLEVNSDYGFKLKDVFTE